MHPNGNRIREWQAVAQPSQDVVVGHANLSERHFMIHDSAPWKDCLAKDTEIVTRWAAKRKSSERRSVLIEQKVFLAAYSMRKLLQAGKLSSSFEGLSVRCHAAPLLRGKKIDRYNAHRFGELYDLDRMVGQTISAPALLDLLIHSLLFSEAVGEDGGVTSFFTTSDHERSTLWLVDIDAFTKLMRRVAVDYPSEAHWARSIETGDYVEWKGQAAAGPSSSQMDRIVRQPRKPRK